MNEKLVVWVDGQILPSTAYKIIPDAEYQIVLNKPLAELFPNKYQQGADPKDMEFEVTVTYEPQDANTIL